MQRKRAAAALSQAGRAGPDEPIRVIPAGRRPHMLPGGRMYATDVRQHSRLMPPREVLNKERVYKSASVSNCQQRANTRLLFHFQVQNSPFPRITTKLVPLLMTLTGP